MANIIVIIFWLTISESLSITWSSTINSLFARNSKYGEIGVNKDLMESVGLGAQMALEHCQEKFKWDRWNCPESAFSRRSSSLLSKEQAFVQAIQFSAIIYSITKNCSRGDFQNCGCDSSREGPNAVDHISSDGEPHAATLGGCSDSTEYGEKVAEGLLIGRRTDDVEKHNYNLGKMLVRSTMVRRCRCHGVSGSCSLQTCWKQLAPFEDIAAELRKKYDRALKIDHGERFNSIGENSLQDIDEDEMVYLNSSPNYCKPVPSLGWNGTQGRTCSRRRNTTHPNTTPNSISLSERRSCRNLCRSCGHRVRRERRQVTRRCNCSFTWCCEVTCSTCTDTVDEFFCE